MAINATTLSGAITANQTSFGVASATGITAPNLQTGAGITYLFVENEMMFVTGVTGTVVNVVRGVLSTQALAHNASAPVLAGLPTDFPNFTPTQTVFVDPGNFYQGVGAPVASAATITATGQIFHVTGTAAIATITPPFGGLEGTITIIPDGVFTWTAAGNIAVAGTTTAISIPVTFFFDRGTNKWYASRLS